METEMIRIFDEDHRPIGIASRSNVHKKGYWHETFHCWVLEKEMIYFQIRSGNKKDYPGLLDITSAGHLLADERVEDGVREIQEEIGLNVMFEDLISLGVVKNSIVSEKMMDREFSHVFAYPGEDVEGRFLVEKDEVSGIVKAQFREFEELIFEAANKIDVVGFEVDESGRQKTVRKKVSLTDFVPHEQDYLKTVATLLKEKFLHLKG